MAKLGHKKIRQRKRLGRTYGGPNTRKPKGLELRKCAMCGGWASANCPHGPP